MVEDLCPKSITLHSHCIIQVLKQRVLCQIWAKIPSLPHEEGTSDHGCFLILAGYGWSIWFGHYCSLLLLRNQWSPQMRLWFQDMRAACAGNTKGYKEEAAQKRTQVKNSTLDLSTFPARAETMDCQIYNDDHSHNKRLPSVIFLMLCFLGFLRSCLNYLQ